MSPARTIAIAALAGLALAAGSPWLFAAAPVRLGGPWQLDFYDVPLPIGVYWPRHVPRAWPYNGDGRLTIETPGQHRGWTWAIDDRWTYVARDDRFGWPFLSFRRQTATRVARESLPLDARHVTSDYRHQLLAKGRPRTPGSPTWGLAVNWLIATSLVAVMIALAGRARRIMAWHAGRRCLCGYELLGLTSAQCPECGRSRPDAPSGSSQ